MIQVSAIGQNHVGKSPFVPVGADGFNGDRFVLGESGGGFFRFLAERLTEFWAINPLETDFDFFAFVDDDQGVAILDPGDGGGEGGGVSLDEQQG